MRAFHTSWFGFFSSFYSTFAAASLLAYITSQEEGFKYLKLEKGDKVAVRRQLEAGVEVDSRGELGVYPTALQKAAENGHLPIVKLLHGRGADVNAKAYGYTPLIIAAKYGHLNTVKYLVEKAGADEDAESMKAAAGAMWENEDDALRFVQKNPKTRGTKHTIWVWSTGSVMRKFQLSHQQVQ